jgi:nicotinamide riboside kinase
MRIAFSGSAGTGKSSLAQRGASELGLPLIGEGMREYLERAKVDLHQLGHEGMRDLVYRLWEERKEAEARAQNGFVADRSSFDFAAFWLYYHYAQENPQTEILFSEALSEDRYEQIWLLPWSRIPLTADGVRTPDRYVQLHLHLLVEGLLQQRGRRWRRLEAVGLEARVQEVLQLLGKEGVRGPP